MGCLDFVLELLSLQRSHGLAGARSSALARMRCMGYLVRGASHRKCRPIRSARMLRALLLTAGRPGRRCLLAAMTCRTLESHWMPGSYPCNPGALSSSVDCSGDCSGLTSPGATPFICRRLRRVLVVTHDRRIQEGHEDGLGCTPSTPGGTPCMSCTALVHNHKSQTIHASREI